MSYTITLIKQFLALVPQFNQLSPEAIADLAKKLKPLRYRMGQVIVMREKMQGQVAIICEGQARLLGYDPRTKMPLTLELLKPGAIIGWINLARGVPCETAMASTEVVCLVLNNQDFLDLLATYPQLKEQFKDRVALLELFELLGVQLENEAQGEWDLKKLAEQAVEEAEVYYLPPGEHQLNTKFTAPLEDPNRLWLVSGGGQIENFPVGSFLELSKFQQTLSSTGEDASLKVKEKPARLISIPRSNWIDDRDGELSEDSQLPSSITKSSDSLFDEFKEDVSYVGSELIQAANYIEEDRSYRRLRDISINREANGAKENLKAVSVLEALEFRPLTIENLAYALEMPQDEVRQIIQRLWQERKINTTKAGIVSIIFPFLRPKKRLSQIDDAATYFTLTSFGYFDLHPVVKVS